MSEMESSLQLMQVLKKLCAFSFPLGIFRTFLRKKCLCCGIHHGCHVMMAIKKPVIECSNKILCASKRRGKVL